MVISTTALPDPRSQAETLIALGVHELAGRSAKDLRDAVGATPDEGALLVCNPDMIAVSALTPLVRHGGRPGFVVADMTDIDDFSSVAAMPDSPVYLLRGLDRGDDMTNWSPAEADSAIAAVGRTALTLGEGLHWLLQQPAALERARCFMTIGSRLRKADGTLDARTPGIWISNGTGRDGADRRDAPKVGWCWAGNRHTWLGFASAAGRRPVPTLTER